MTVGIEGGVMFDSQIWGTAWVHDIAFLKIGGKHWQGTSGSIEDCEFLCGHVDLESPLRGPVPTLMLIRKFVTQN